MYLVAIGWIYVVLMMAAAELASPSGTVLGALVTLLLYGVLPVGVLHVYPGRADAQQGTAPTRAEQAAQHR